MMTSSSNLPWALELTMKRMNGTNGGRHSAGTQLTSRTNIKTTNSANGTNGNGAKSTGQTWQTNTTKTMRASGSNGTKPTTGRRLQQLTQATMPNGTNGGNGGQQARQTKSKLTKTKTNGGNAYHTGREQLPGGMLTTLPRAVQFRCRCKRLPAVLAMTISGSGTTRMNSRSRRKIPWILWCASPAISIGLSFARCYSWQLIIALCLPDISCHFTLAKLCSGPSWQIPSIIVGCTQIVWLLKGWDLGGLQNACIDCCKVPWPRQASLWQRTATQTADPWPHWCGEVGGQVCVLDMSYHFPSNLGKHVIL